MNKIFFIFLFFTLLFGDAFKFIKNDSFIIDPYNNNRITTEAQGYGLLFALQRNDKRLFDSILKWTNEHMKNSNGLFGWLYNKKLLDSNNATDADLFIAFALFRAYDRWGDERYLKEAKSILLKIKELIVPVCWDRVNFLLLPGEYGFIKNDKIEIFPSYYIHFIFRYFYKRTSNPLWKDLLDYTYSFAGDILTDKMIFSLYKKRFFLGDKVSMDVYRVILYAYLDNPENIGFYKKSFKEIDSFFKSNGYIPLVYILGSNYQMKKESPYCVYKWFYLLYKDKKYLNKYNKLKTLDKNNYFCTFLDEISKGGW